MLKFKKAGKTVGILKDDASEPEWLEEHNPLVVKDELESPRVNEGPTQTAETSEEEEKEEEDGTV